MRFWYRICQLYYSLGILSLLIATADQVFGWNLFPNGYPAGETNAAGQSVGSSYGHFMLVAGATTLVAFLLGTFLNYRLNRRYEEAIVVMEAIRAQGYEEAQDEPEDPRSSGPS